MSLSSLSSPPLLLLVLVAAVAAVVPLVAQPLPRPPPPSDESHVPPDEADEELRLPSDSPPPPPCRTFHFARLIMTKGKRGEEGAEGGGKVGDRPALHQTVGECAAVVDAGRSPRVADGSADDRENGWGNKPRLDFPTLVGHKI